MSTTTSQSDPPPKLARLLSDMPISERMEQKGIPAADLLENIGQYLSEKGLSVEEALHKAEENFKKYKLVEANFVEQKAKFQENIEDYKKSLAALDMLAEQKAAGKDSVEVTYKLDENVYSKATIESFDKVCVWLGANVMVEYELEEAQQMLTTNMNNVEKAVTTMAEELDFLRDQITTSEVNVAHLYNYKVQNAHQSEKGGGT